MLYQHYFKTDPKINTPLIIHTVNYTFVTISLSPY